MAKQVINIGRTANDRSGDPLRTAFNKVNENFTELYSAADRLTNGTHEVVLDSDGILNLPVGGDIQISGQSVLGGSGGIPNVLGSGPTNVSITDMGNSVTISIADHMQDWVFGLDGSITFPDTTKQTTAYTGGDGTGLSINDFGDGFGLDNANKIVTRKLYSTNLTNSNQHYRLELDTNGVVHLPDQSIINGATLRVTPGTGELNYAALAAGPSIEQPEKTWIWADANGAWVATDSYSAYNTWHFDNSGILNIPSNGAGLKWSNPDEPPMPLGGWHADSLISVEKNVGLHISNGVGGIGSVEWVFDKAGDLTVPGDIKSQVIPATGFILQNVRIYDGENNETHQYIWLNAGSDNNILALNNYNGGDLTGFTVEVWDNGSLVSSAQIVEMNPQGYWSFATDDALSKTSLSNTLTFISPDYAPSSYADISITAGSSNMSLGPDGARLDTTGNIVLLQSGLHGVDISSEGTRIYHNNHYLEYINGTFTVDGTINAEYGLSLESINNDVNISSGPGIADLENTYLADRIILSEYLAEFAGTPAVDGLTTPYSYATYTELMSMLPGSFMGQEQATALAKTVSDDYILWQDTLSAQTVNVNVGGYTWEFSGDGTLTLPDASQILGNNMTIRGSSVSVKVTNPINPLAPSEWGFDGRGFIVFPDGARQTAAYQVVVAPTTSKGSATHKAGMVAFDNSNFYWCKADYVDGSADIWNKMAWTSNSEWS